MNTVAHVDGLLFLTPPKRGAASRTTFIGVIGVAINTNASRGIVGYCVFYKGYWGMAVTIEKVPVGSASGASPSQMSSLQAELPSQSDRLAAERLMSESN